MCHTEIHHITELVLPLLLLSALIASAAEPTPPVAPTADHREERHGATVVDNYYWLREKSNPKVVEYLEAENAYTKAMTADLAPFQDALYKEMLSHVKQTDLSVPVRRGDYCTTRAPKRASSTPFSAAAKAAWKRPKKSCWI
jgi:oligopeptidase B